MTAKSAIDTYFEAIQESQSALFEAVTASIGRSSRLSSSFLVEVQRSQQELLEFGRAFVAQPSQLLDMPRRVQASADRSQERRREVQREWSDEFAQARTETLETLERLEAQRRVIDDRTAELAQRALDTVIDRLQDGLHRLIEPAEAAHGAREPGPANQKRVAPTQSAAPSPPKVAAKARRKRTSPPPWLASSASPATPIEASAATPTTAPEERRGEALPSDAHVTA